MPKKGIFLLKNWLTNISLAALIIIGEGCWLFYLPHNRKSFKINFSKSKI